MLAKILFVDDDANILAGFERQLRKSFALETALGAKEGLDVIGDKGPFSVIVSDLRMPGMDGIQFLSRAREKAPDSVRMMLTGYADLDTAISAVNEGNIFRFLTKPCEPEVLVKALGDGVRQYDLVTAERELLEKTLRGSLKVLSEILELVNPEAFGRASRITSYVREVGKEMRVADLWQLETAAALSQIGCVILPEDALKKLYQGLELTGEDSQLFSMHPFIASDLLAHIPRMQSIAEIIANQEKNFDGSGIPMDNRSGEDIPLGARILKAVLDFDTLRVKGTGKIESVEQLAGRVGNIDVVYEAAGATQTAFDLLQVLGTDAVYCFTGVPRHGEPISIDTHALLYHLVLKNQVILGTVNAGKDAFEAAIRDLLLFYQRWPDAVRALITGRYAIEEFREPVFDRSGIKNVIVLDGRT
jgi:response regulator RpfG family c-di-GMP phosphodiesterase